MFQNVYNIGPSEHTLVSERKRSSVHYNIPPRSPVFSLTHQGILTESYTIYILKHSISYPNKGDWRETGRGFTLQLLTLHPSFTHSHNKYITNLNASTTITTTSKIKLSSLIGRFNTYNQEQLLDYGVLIMYTQFQMYTVLNHPLMFQIVIYIHSFIYVVSDSLLYVTLRSLNYNRVSGCHIRSFTFPQRVSGHTQLINHINIIFFNYHVCESGYYNEVDIFSIIIA